MMSQKKDKKTLYWGDKILYPTRNCRKIQYDNHKGESIWRRPTFIYKGDSSNNKIELQFS